MVGAFPTDLLCPSLLFYGTSSLPKTALSTTPLLRFVAPPMTTTAESGIPRFSSPGTCHSWVFSTLQRFAPLPYCLPCFMQAPPMGFKELWFPTARPCVEFPRCGGLLPDLPVSKLSGFVWRTIHRPTTCSRPTDWYIQSENTRILRTHLHTTTNHSPCYHI